MGERKNETGEICDVQSITSRQTNGVSFSSSLRQAIPEEPTQLLISVSRAKSCVEGMGRTEQRGRRANGNKTEVEARETEGKTRGFSRDVRIPGEARGLSRRARLVYVPAKVKRWGLEIRGRKGTLR